MKITALEEYGLRCLLSIARRASEEAPVAAQVIADEQGISLPYAQKILRELNGAGLVDSRRGANGGYVLARAVEAITVGDVLRSLGSLFETEHHCDRHGGEHACCVHSDACSIRPVWDLLADFVSATLDRLPLSVLLGSEADVARHLTRVAPVTPELLCPIGQPARETPRPE